MIVSSTPLVDIVQELPFDLAAEVQDHVAFLLEKRDGGAAHVVASSWPPDFFETTGGALAGDATFARPLQGAYESRFPTGG